MTDSQSLSLENRIAVITGASRGIGSAIALEFASQGADVVINYNQDEEGAKEVLDQVRTMGRKGKIIQADISDSDSANQLINLSLDEFEKIDILVNNAGITRDTLLLRMKESDWDEVIDTNLKGTFNCSKAVLRNMMRKKYGRIINISSIAGLIGNTGQTNYSASKAGQIGFTKALAREVASRNITVNAIAAGYIDTTIWDTVPDIAKSTFLDMIPMKRKGNPEEIAHLACFLASEQASYITGQVIAVDGGISMI